MRRVRVRSIKILDVPDSVCDVTVADNHNLFVSNQITEKPILCHNCHDENVKFVSAITGEFFYSLLRQSLQYGYTGYIDGNFKKSDRATIETRDLDEDLLRYMTQDVVVPFAIHEGQRALGRHIGHKKYESVVREQYSDLIQAFSKMESNGSLVDTKYLFYLKSPDSPIEKVIDDLAKKFMQTPAAKKANSLICRSHGVTGGLWGETQMFSLKKEEHKQVLFFNVLKLKPIAKGARGGKLDKKFQEAYKDVPEVAMFTELGKARKLKNAYVNSFLKLLGSNDDFKSDRRIRPDYNYLIIVTGRTSASNPNLQQIPSRSELGKHIKRLFIAPEGHLYIKVDYRVHEVRGWGIISLDEAVGRLFQAAKDLRDEYRVRPTSTLAKRIKLEADVHVMNAAYFFSKAVEEVDKVLRNAVKGVIFGLIYQMAIKTLAGVLGKDLDFTTKLVKNFQKRFPNGMKWIEHAKEFARKNLYYENPLGFRRHLWGYAIPASAPDGEKIHADMDRRAVNSPIQGMCSQFMMIGARQLDKMLFRLRRTKKRVVDFFIANSVHDSLETTFAYKDFMLGLDYVERALTDKVRDEVKRRHNFNFVVDLEIDFEVGASLSSVQAWDFSYPQLVRIVLQELNFQRYELGHKVRVDQAMDAIFTAFDDYPQWMHKQMANLNEDNISYGIGDQEQAREYIERYRKAHKKYLISKKD